VSVKYNNFHCNHSSKGGGVEEKEELAVVKAVANYFRKITNYYSIIKHMVRARERESFLACERERVYKQYVDAVRSAHTHTHISQIEFH
jgi:hypothetical protein